MLNSIAIQGRMIHTPEAKVTKSGKDVCTFSIACDRQSGGQKETDFFNCTAFGKQAEFVERYLKQGTKILLSGRVQNDNYTNKEGQKVYSVQIIAEELEFAESKNASANNQNMGGGYAAPAGRPSPAAAVGDGFMNIPDGVDDVDLPFN